jgi:long-chain fatty acid transport protein
LVGVGVLCTTTPRFAWAAGFAITAQGAAASGKSSAFTAQADDPSALFYNPAGIAQLRTAALLVGTSVIIPHTEYRPESAGLSDREDHQTFFPSHLYVTIPLGQRVTVGLGAFSPFGVGTEWPQDWDGRFQVTSISVRTTSINPTLAWRPAESVAVAVGVNVSVVNLKYRRALNLAAFGPTTPEGDVSLRGDARALGFNGGVLITPSPWWRVGASLRSRLHAEVKDGHADFSVPAPLSAAFADGPIRTEVDLPPSLRLGVFLQPTPMWNVEFDAAWTGWSTIDRLTVGFENGLPDDTTPFSWENAMAYSLGTEYRWTAFRIRGGYTYDVTPIPDETVSPLLPDGNRQWWSVGVGTTGERWSLDAAYQFIVFDRVKANTFGSGFSSAAPPIDARANGSYRSHAHVIGVSMVYRL